MIISSMDKVLHVFDDDDIDRMNLLLGKQKSFELNAPIGTQNSSNDAVWLIQMPHADESLLSHIFRRSPLRLDSHVFAIRRQGNYYFEKYIISLTEISFNKKPNS